MGRDDDFSEYVRARWTALTRTAMLHGCTAHEAEDAVQTTLMRCYASWDKVERAHSRDAYVYRSLMNNLSTSRRRRWWGEQSSSELPERPGGDATGAVDDADQVLRAIRYLTPPNRAVVVLRYYAELSESEIAAALGIAPGTVKSRLSRGLAHLSAVLTASEGNKRRRP
jgi:RNA polymerase sigma-70 factor (sigma-E family)